ncbi:MAG: carbohydrate-binding protein [Akkermansiaceae bacterium]|nr:carbohydrate-binding protein [Akkermansiaceae bacterium]
MKSCVLTAAQSTILSAALASAAHQMEYLDRGLIALRSGPGEVLVSWRLLGDEPADAGFHVYRSDDGAAPVRLTDSPLTGATRYVDTAAGSEQDHVYHVRAIHAGVGQPISKGTTLPADSPVQTYFRMPLLKPADVPDDGTTAAHSFSANDASAADLDGDGAYEIILKWDPSNSKDNSQSGHTGRVYIDAYKPSGAMLWRIDLGPNIRAGAHYTQFIVYDFDGDGKAELACRTAPGSVDGTGSPVADPAKWQNAGGPARPTFSHATDYRNSGGYVLSGPEFLTFFDGETGAELVSTSFIPFRDPDNLDHSPTTTRIKTVWGDNYGNRIDRFLAGAAYLDGTRPSLLMCRGYYTRTFLVAWDWRGGTLTRRWVFDSAAPGNSGYAGQGAHSLTVGDVDSDGRDEIIYGACAIDDDGSGLYSTGIGHGDALHLSDMDPDRPGLEVWMVHETPSQYGVHGSELHDAATGAILFSVPATVDIGRGVAADIDPRTRGYEAWSSRANLHDVDGNEIVSSRPSPMNFFCWWDGDLLREMLDGTTVSKWNWTSNNATTLLAASGVSSNNTTKATPCLSADLFGDWREEIVWRESDSSALRIHTTPIPTDLRLPTLMHDRQYRLAIAWQNVGYNQPPHPGFYLGDGMGTPPHAEFTFVTPPDAPEPVAGRFPAWLAARGLDPGLDPNLDHDGNGMTLFAEYAFDLPGPPPLRMRQDGGTLTLDLAAVRDELDYRIETTTDFVEWTPLLTLAGEAGPRAEIALTGGEPRCFYRAAALSGPGAPVLTEVTTTMQAEDAAFNGSLDSNHTGFHGSGFINSAASGSFIEWSGVDGGIGGAATLTFRFALGATAARTGRLVINGSAQDLTFAPTGAWNAWATMDVPASLPAGPGNTIRLETNGQDLANIDEISVTVFSESP